MHRTASEQLLRIASHHPRYHHALRGSLRHDGSLNIGRLIRIAYSNHELRSALLPILREAANQPGRRKGKAEVSFLVWTMDAKDPNGGALPQKRPGIRTNRKSIPAKWFMPIKDLKKKLEKVTDRKKRRALNVANKAGLAAVRKLYKAWFEKNWVTAWSAGEDEGYDYEPSAEDEDAFRLKAVNRVLGGIGSLKPSHKPTLRDLKRVKRLKAWLETGSQRREDEAAQADWEAERIESADYWRKDRAEKYRESDRYKERTRGVNKKEDPTIAPPDPQRSNANTLPTPDLPTNRTNRIRTFEKEILDQINDHKFSFMDIDQAIKTLDLDEDELEGIAGDLGLRYEGYQDAKDEITRYWLALLNIKKPNVANSFKAIIKGIEDDPLSIKQASKRAQELTLSGVNPTSDIEFTNQTVRVVNESGFLKVFDKKNINDRLKQAEYFKLRGVVEATGDGGPLYPFHECLLSLLRESPPYKEIKKLAERLIRALAIASKANGIAAAPEITVDSIPPTAGRPLPPSIYLKLENGIQVKLSTRSSTMIPNASDKQNYLDRSDSTELYKWIEENEQITKPMSLDKLHGIIANLGLTLGIPQRNQKGPERFSGPLLPENTMQQERQSTSIHGDNLFSSEQITSRRNLHPAWFEQERKEEDDKITERAKRKLKIEKKKWEKESHLLKYRSKAKKHIKALTGKSKLSSKLSTPASNTKLLMSVLTSLGLLHYKHSYEVRTEDDNYIDIKGSSLSSVKKFLTPGRTVIITSSPTDGDDIRGRGRRTKVELPMNASENIKPANRANMDYQSGQMFVPTSDNSDNELVIQIIKFIHKWVSKLISEMKYPHELPLKRKKVIRLTQSLERGFTPKEITQQFGEISILPVSLSNLIEISKDELSRLNPSLIPNSYEEILQSLRRNLHFLMNMGEAIQIKTMYNDLKKMTQGKTFRSENEDEFIQNKSLSEANLTDADHENLILWAEDTLNILNDTPEAELKTRFK